MTESWPNILLRFLAAKWLLLSALGAAAGGALFVDQVWEWQKLRQRQARDLLLFRPSQAELMKRYKAPVAANTPAPDFTLPRLSDLAPVRLSELGGTRPVVLVMGGFGCQKLCDMLQELTKLYDRYHARADFFFIYLDLGAHEPEALAAPDRLTYMRERLAHFGFRMPCLVDIDKHVQDSYDAYPARLFIIDPPSRIAFDSGGILMSGLSPGGAAAWLEKHTKTR